MRSLFLRLLVSLAALVALVPFAQAQTQLPLDHFKCYAVLEGKAVDVPVGLRDQFDPAGTLEEALVWQPVRLCNPVEKVRGRVVTRSNTRRITWSCTRSRPPSWPPSAT